MSDYFGFEREESSIISKEEVLMGNYLPDQILYRESQLQAIADAIKPLLTKKYPDNLFIYGNSGTGKTSSVRFIVKQMQAHSDSVLPVYVNCWENYTQLSVYNRIIEEMKLPLPRRGIATDELFDRILQYIRNYRKPILLLLDELDGLHHDELLYTISRANDKDGILFGIISMTNNRDLLSRLDSRIRSSLRFSDMEFPDYTPEQIVGILKNRAEIGLVPGSWDERLLNKISNHSVKGSARLALQYLWKAAKKAEKKSRSKIMIQDFEDICLNDDSFQLLHENRLSPNEEIIIRLLKNGPMNSSELYDKFRQEMPKTKRQIRNYINILEKKGIIELKESRNRGMLKTHLISLKG